MLNKIIKMYKRLTTKDLIGIANIYAIDKWERQVYEDWDGHDLVGDNYIFQLSFWGTIRIFEKSSVIPISLGYDHEDILRKHLFSIGRKYINTQD